MSFEGKVLTTSTTTTKTRCITVFERYLASTVALSLHITTREAGTIENVRTSLLDILLYGNSTMKHKLYCYHGTYSYL